MPNDKPCYSEVFGAVPGPDDSYDGNICFDPETAHGFRRLIRQRRIAAMNEIDVSLFCPAQHHVGNLVKNATQIGYRPLGGQQLAAWPPHQADMWWEVSCPDGCPGAFGGAVDPIRQEVDRLAADPSRTTAHYTLKRVG